VCADHRPDRDRRPLGWLRPVPSLTRAYSLEAGKGGPGACALQPRPTDEHLLGVFPATLAPGAQAQAVKGAQEGTVVDQAPGQHPSEAIGKRLLPNGNGPVVQLGGPGRLPGRRGPSRRTGGLMAALLEVRDMHVAYGKIEAVRGISFDVVAGQVVAIIGSNGLARRRRVARSRVSCAAVSGRSLRRRAHRPASYP